MNRNLLKALSVILVLTFMFSLVGCGESKPQESKPQESKAAEVKASSAAPAPKDEKVTISFITSRTRENKESNSVVFWQIMDKFVKDNPNIVINFEPLAADVYETKIKTLGATNELPDLFIYKGSMVNTFVQNKLVTELNDELDKDAGWKSKLLPEPFEEFTRNGKVYGIPLQLTVTSMIYYNKKILDECGVTSFPKTWTEFKDALVKIKAKGYTPIALGNKAKWPAESCILSTLGDRFTGTEWMRNIRDKKGGKFTDPEFIKSLAALQEIAKMGAFNSDVNSIDHKQHLTLYFNGKAAMFIDGGWAVNSVVTGAPKDILDVTQFARIPAVDGGKGDPTTVSGGSGWAIGINPKLSGAKKDAAVKIIKAITDTNYGKLSVETNGFPPVKVTDYDKSKISPLATKFWDVMQSSKLVPIYDAHFDASLIEVMNSGLQELLIGTITPEELAKRIQAEYEKSK